MKYRLLRFEPGNAKPILDVRVITPNQLGCNKEWVELVEGRWAILLEYRTKMTKSFTAGVDVEVTKEIHFYTINPDRAKPMQTFWAPMSRDYAISLSKYLQMLDLTNAL